MKARTFGLVGLFVVAAIGGAYYYRHVHRPAPVSNYIPKVIGVVPSSPTKSGLSKYTLRRSLPIYLRVFGRDLGRALFQASGHTHIVDFGAGEGLFALQLAKLVPMQTQGKARSSAMASRLNDHHMEFWSRYSKRKRPRIPKFTTITYKTNVASRLEQIEAKNPKIKKFAAAHLEVFQGRMFKDIPAAELTKKFGPVDLGVDLWGVLAYTQTPTEDLAKIHSIMRRGGYYFVHDSVDKAGVPLSYVLTPQGREPFDRFLQKNLRGFNVHPIDRNNGRISSHFMILVKNRDPFSFPKLTLVKLEGEKTQNQGLHRVFSVGPTNSL